METVDPPAPFGGAQPGDIIRLGEFPLAEFLRVVEVFPPGLDKATRREVAELVALRADDDEFSDGLDVVVLRHREGQLRIKVVGKWTADDEKWEGE